MWPFNTGHCSERWPHGHVWLHLSTLVISSYSLSGKILLKGRFVYLTNWMTCIEHEKENILFGIVPWCLLLVIQKLWSLSMFQTIFLLHQNSSISTWPVCTGHKYDFIPFSIDSRCLLQIGDESPDKYVYVLSHPPLIYMWVSVCTFMCIYLFSCPSVPAPQLLIFHREYLSWYIVVAYQS